MQQQRAFDDKHIIDILIEERAPTLAGSILWPALRAILYKLLDYPQAVAMAEQIAPLAGLPALEAVSELLRVQLRVSGLDHIPRTGRCVIIANHPTGIADGIAAWDAIKPVRPDLVFYANADAHRVAPGLIDVLIPVEWEEHKRTREKTRDTLRLTQAAFDAERALFIFPAGRLARFDQGELRDPDWMSSAVSLARKNNAPLIPIHMSGPFSLWFHVFDRMSKELRDITLFKELLNKKEQMFTLRAGPAISPEFLVGDTNMLTQPLKAHIEEVMARDPSHPFNPLQPQPLPQPAGGLGAPAG